VNISGVSGDSTPATIEAQRLVLIVKKHQDVQQDVAQALLQLVKEAVPPGTGRLIDVRA